MRPRAAASTASPLAVMLVLPKLGERGGKVEGEGSVRNDKTNVTIDQSSSHLSISRVGIVRSRSARAGQLASVMPSLCHTLMVMRMDPERMRWEKEREGPYYSNLSVEWLTSACAMRCTPASVS